MVIGTSTEIESGCPVEAYSVSGSNCSVNHRSRVLCRLLSNNESFGPDSLGLGPGSCGARIVEHCSIRQGDRFDAGDSRGEVHRTRCAQESRRGISCLSGRILTLEEPDEISRDLRSPVFPVRTVRLRPKFAPLVRSDRQLARVPRDQRWSGTGDDIANLLGGS